MSAAVSDSLVVTTRRSASAALDCSDTVWRASPPSSHGDSIYGASSSPLGRLSIVLPNRADLLLNSAAVDARAGVAPTRGRLSRDSAEMLLDRLGAAPRSRPSSLAIEGEERITVPAGDFDCWIVSLETERASARLWVTKQSQIVARSEQILPELEGAMLTRVLLQTDSPALMPASARLPQ